MSTPPEPRWSAVTLVLLLIAGLVVVAWGVAHPGALASSAPAPSTASTARAGVVGALPTGDPTSDPTSAPTSDRTSDRTTPPPSSDATTAAASPSPAATRGATLPWGGRRVLADHATLVAYYGTAGTGALGVLGETSPAQMQRRLERAARGFRRPGHPVRLVYELIVTIADRYPGPDRSYSHPLPRAAVERYVRAAHRHGALLLLDVQPGHEPFPAAARHWAWALRKPWVGLALDPEWRLPRGVAPAQRVGSVSAAEVNRTSAWLAGLVRRERLPQKLFVIHQFRVAMVRDIGAVRRRPGLAMVQHVDGFGTPREKLATYRAVARPDRFAMGFKLFYDEDVRRLTPSQVLALRPRVRFVSYQ